MAKDQEVLTGTVAKFYPANGNRPAKFIVDANDETFELTVYPENGVEQPWDEESKLPAFMNGLPPDPVGVSIQAIAEPKGEYNGVRQYKPSKITVLGSKPSPKPTAQAAPGSTATPPSVDPNQMRIMRQSTLHYASILIAPMVKDFETPQLMVERTIELAGILLEYVISGENPYALKEKPEEEEPEDDFGSI